MSEIKTESAILKLFFRTQIALAVFLAQRLVGQRQRTGTNGQHQQQPRPPQQQIQHVPLYQQPQQHVQQHSLEGLVVWEVLEEAVLVQLIKMVGLEEETWRTQEDMEDNLEAQLAALEDQMVHLGNLVGKMWDPAGIMQFPVLGTELQLLAPVDPVKILMALLEDQVQACQAPLGQEDQGNRTEDQTEFQMEDQTENPMED